MAVEFESYATFTSAARSDDDEKAGSERRGSRWITFAGTSRTHEWAGGIDGIGISDGIDISGVSDGHEEIGTRRT
jgi:hypothetical protein